MALTKTRAPPSIVPPASPPTRKSCHSTNAMPAYDSTNAITARRVIGFFKRSGKDNDDRGIEEQHKPLERGRDVLQAEEVEQAREVVTEKSQPRDRAPIGRCQRPRCWRTARKPRHRNEERRRVKHP